MVFPTSTGARAPLMLTRNGEERAVPRNCDVYAGSSKKANDVHLRVL
jgi:hypothetical protein